MNKIAFAILSFLISSACYADNCTIPEKAILGDWQAVTKFAPFEVMSFEKDSDGKSFNSWRHERPDYTSGKWEYSSCVVRIRHASDEKLNLELLVITASKGSIELRDQKQSTVFRYKRIGQSR